MKDSRVGETLWAEWDGDGFDQTHGVNVYYTIDYVDLENDIVRRALASSIQRDGVADSLSEAFKLLENLTVSHGYVGVIEDELSYIVCDEYGETFYGDYVEDIEKVTWVEF